MPSLTTTHIPAANGQVPHTLEEVKKKFSVFDGLGKFPGKPYHINLDPEILPKWVPCRPVPVHQQEEFKRQLTEMQQAGVLVPVTQSTPWISSYMNVESEDTKGGKKFHICLDLKNLNKAILHEPFFTCTLNDVYAKLSKAKTLTVINFKKGFWQVELDEESSYLMAFNTPFGSFRFTCLPFGLTVSGDVFQHKLDAIYGDLSLTIGCADDMIIWGEKDDLSDHDAALDKFLQVTRQHRLCLGFDKIQYKREEISFYGDTYTDHGHKLANERKGHCRDAQANKCERATKLPGCL